MMAGILLDNPGWCKEPMSNGRYGAWCASCGSNPHWRGLSCRLTHPAGPVKGISRLSYSCNRGCGPGCPVPAWWVCIR